jgi:broad specificity phosphatase PhoE
MANCTFHLIRHALVDPSAHGIHYGVLDVPLCAATLRAEAPRYAVLAGRLPRPAHWVVTPLSRTTATAQAIFGAGYGPASLTVEPGLLTQDIGAWHGLAHDDLPARLTRPAHPFWPMAADEVPPGGESVAAMLARAGATLERLAEAHAGRDVVVVSHGGAIRAAVAHALRIAPADALRLAVDNLSVTQIERHAAGWRVLRVNEVPAAPAAA